MTKTRESGQLAGMALITLLLCMFSACGGGGNGSGARNSCALTANSQMLGAAATAAGKQAAMLPSSSARQAGGGVLKPLHGHILSQLASSSDQGKFDETQELPVSVSLKPGNEELLGQELMAIYQPGSPKYRQFLTPAEFRARFSPTDDQLAKVTAYLQQQGLHSISTDKNGLLVHAVGSVHNLNSAFNTEIHQFADSKGHTFHAPSFELQTPVDLPIQSVHGLESLTVAHTHLQGPVKSTVPNRAGTGPGGGYAPADIRTAYNVPGSLDGSGQTLGLFELDGYNSSDITAYETQFGLAATPLQNVLIDGAAGSAGGGAAEVTLDIELMIALAPKASQIIVYEGPNSSQGMLDTYSRIASDNVAKSVSTSWGSSETSETTAFIQSENTIFMEMAAQGQTIYSASGANDNGSSLSVDDPSSQPYVVGVGGTTLTTGASSTYVSEATWNDSGGAGGGGISSIWTIPSWQQGVASSTNKASSTMRNVPDVALHADINSGYAIYTGGSWGSWGGTSCAAPLWAAFTALVNQLRAQSGVGPVGYVTPALYAIGKSNLYGSDFHDIADGSTNQFYPATQGYDDATGWGSFNAVNMIQDLSGDSGAALSCA